MILTLSDHRDGQTKEMRLWGVTAVKEIREPREFLIPVEGKPKEEWRFNDRAYEKAMEERTERMLDFQPDPMEKFRAAHYMVQIYIFKKVRYVGKRRFPRGAAELYDSALFHLWGFLKNPQESRFNFFEPKDALTSPPREQLEVASLRKKLLRELARKNIDPDPFSWSFGQYVQANKEAVEREEKRKQNEWEEMQRKHL